MSSNTLGKLSLRVFLHVGALVTLFTIFLCYSLAASLGHVKPWLPTISKCADRSPEKYPFRLGLVISSMLGSAEVVIIYTANMVYSRNKLALLVGLIAFSSLGVVAVVNTVENNSVHSGAAVAFFFLYWFYMVLMTWGTTIVTLCKKYLCGITTEHGWNHPCAIISLFRHLLAILCGILLIVAIILKLHWGKSEVYFAICEWSGMILMVIFNWSYVFDMSHLYLANIVDSSSETLNTGEKKRLLP